MLETSMLAQVMFKRISYAANAAEWMEKESKT